MTHSFFKKVRECPPDPIFHLNAAFEDDCRPYKVNLSIGVYQDEACQIPIFHSVKKAEQHLLSYETTKAYLPIEGNSQFLERIGVLIFGKTYADHICGMQVPGGTSGLRIGAEFLKQEISRIIAIPDPTWPNHRGILEESGLELHPFSYYDLDSHQLNFPSIMQAVRTAPPFSTILFHACCHNPTGADLSLAQWNEVAHLMQERKILPFFDFAYQGLGHGLEEDAKPIRLFVEKSIECMVAASYSKNFGLYSERVGALFVVMQDAHCAHQVLSKLKILARTTYSNPPRHGAAIVSHILGNPELRQTWENELSKMQKRLDYLRKKWVHALQSRQKKRDFTFLLNRVGMFCFLGLEQKQISQLKQQYGIYLSESGRMNITGLSEQNFNYVVDSIVAIL